MPFCVDNTDVIDSSSDASSVEEGQISDEDVSISVEVEKSIPQRPVLEIKQPVVKRKLASPVHSDDETNLVADIDDLETFGVSQVLMDGLLYKYTTIFMCVLISTLAMQPSNLCIGTPMYSKVLHYVREA